MDYCSACRRHLNGALVCPGCGAYAPDIAPNIALPSAEAADPTWDTAFASAAPHASASHAFAPGEGPGGLPARGDVEPAPGADVPEGRAARRRQRARWRKNQRRAVVATAFALVGGGLTAAALDRDGAGRALAASAPQDLPTTSPAEQTPSYEPAPATPPAAQPSTPASPAADSARDHETPPPATAPRHAEPDVHRAAIPAAPRTAAPKAPSAVPSADRPVTVLPTAPPPGAADEPQQPAATEPAAPATPPTTGTQPNQPAQPGSSDQQLCLLVICIG
ncbi:hypothetical protein ACGFMM_35335 [Streptomyces sp. NPDC048604]|uniref:SCO2400 family protein n=1 Tax=Streptomyces sp. NPDC048604 TaxID=3365578 RepID=UPI003722236D